MKYEPVILVLAAVMIAGCATSQKSDQAKAVTPQPPLPVAASDNSAKTAPAIPPIDEPRSKVSVKIETTGKDGLPHGFSASNIDVPEGQPRIIPVSTGEENGPSGHMIIEKTQQGNGTSMRMSFKMEGNLLPDPDEKELDKPVTNEPPKSIP